MHGIYTNPSKNLVTHEISGDVTTLSCNNKTKTRIPVSVSYKVLLYILFAGAHLINSILQVLICFLHSSPGQFEDNSHSFTSE